MNRKTSLLLMDPHSLSKTEEAKCSFFQNYNIELTLLEPFGKGPCPGKREKRTYRVISGKTLGKRPYRAFFLTGLVSALLKKPDCILFLSDPFCFWTLQALFFKRLFSPKSRFIFHSWDNVRFTTKNFPQSNVLLFFIDSVIEKVVLRYSDVAICRNREAVKVLKEKGFKKRVEFLPWGVDTGIFKPLERGSRPSLDFQEELPVVGYIGRFVPEKGISLLVEAVSKMEMRVNLLLVGSGCELGTIKTVIENLNLLERVMIIESVSPEKVPGYFNSIDILVLPSISAPTWKEQFGRVLVEAMACKVAVVGSSSGAIPEVIADCGLVFREGDSEDLCQKITSIILDPQKRKILGEKGRVRAAEVFSWNAFARETTEKVIKRGKQPGKGEWEV
ncbi:MAG: glycosyltransferase [Nitrospinota bacterium]